MRIQISRKLAGSVDGIRLDRFRPGQTYDVGGALACYLMAIGAVDCGVDEKSKAVWGRTAIVLNGPASSERARRAAHL